MRINPVVYWSHFCMFMRHSTFMGKENQIETGTVEHELASKLRASYNLRTSDLKKSIQITKELLDECDALGNMHLAAIAKNHLGLFFLIQGEFDKAQDYSLQALGYFESVKDQRGIADAKYNIGSIYYRTNKYHQALLLLADSL